MHEHGIFSEDAAENTLAESLARSHFRGAYLYVARTIILFVALIYDQTCNMMMSEVILAENTRHGDVHMLIMARLQIRRIIAAFGACALLL